MDDQLTRLEQAISQGSRDDVVKLIEKEEVDVNKKNEFSGRTPLHVAVVDGNFDIVKLLLEAGAETSIYSKDKNGDTPLNLAVYHTKDEGIIKLLVKMGAPIFSENNDDLNPVQLSIRQNNLIALDSFIEAGLGQFINEQGHDGSTVLHWAASHTQVKRDTLQLLLDSGAKGSIHLKCRTRGNTPIHLAAMNWDATDNFELLLRAVPDVAAINYVNADGRTALHLASAGGKIEFVDLLIERGAIAPIDVQSDDGKTPLLEAVTSERINGTTCQTKIIKSLIDAGANVNIKKSYMTPLQFLLGRPDSCNNENVKLLIEAGADVNSQDYTNGYTAVHVAAINHDASLLEYLHSKGVRVNLRDNKGLIPLYHAIDCDKNESHFGIIQELVKSFDPIYYHENDDHRHFQIDFKFHQKIISLLENQVDILKQQTETQKRELENSTDYDDWLRVVKFFERQKRASNENSLSLGGEPNYYKKLASRKFDEQIELALSYLNSFNLKADRTVDPRKFNELLKYQKIYSSINSSIPRVSQETVIVSWKLDELKKEVDDVQLSTDSSVRILKDELAKEKEKRKLVTKNMEKLMKIHARDANKNFGKKTRYLLLVLSVLISFLAYLFTR